MSNNKGCFPIVVNEIFHPSQFYLTRVVMGYNPEYRKFTYNRGPIAVPRIVDDLIVLCVYELYIYIIASVPRTPHIPNNPHGS